MMDNWVLSVTLILSNLCCPSFKILMNYTSKLNVSDLLVSYKTFKSKFLVLI